MSALDIIEFSGLPGIKKLKTKGTWARTPSGFISKLDQGWRAVNSAGDDGSATVWIDDDGAFRCGFFRYMATLDMSVVHSKAAVKRWLIEWLPRLYEFHGGGRL